MSKKVLLCLKTYMPKALMWFKLLEKIYLKTSKIFKILLEAFLQFCLTGKQVRVQILNL